MNTGNVFIWPWSRSTLSDRTVSLLSPSREMAGLVWKGLRSCASATKAGEKRGAQPGLGRRSPHHSSSRNGRTRMILPTHLRKHIPQTINSSCKHHSKMERISAVRWLSEPSCCLQPSRELARAWLLCLRCSSMSLFLERQWRMSQGLGPCNPHGRSKRSSKSLALAWPWPSLCDYLGSEPWIDFCHSAFQINLFF